MEEAGSDSPLNVRADIYHFLAEAVSDPPEWLSHPGSAWPLYGLVSSAASQSRAALKSLAVFKAIPGGSLADRKKRYRSLITGHGNRVPIAMYESLFCSGRIAGPEMFAVERIYREHGLHPQSNELPDHASMELAFLAYLVRLDCGSGSHRTRERRFIKTRVGTWLISVGRQMAETGDPVYEPIGRFLADWLNEAVTGNPGRKPQSAPVLSSPSDCILCGFCAQVCPTGALSVLENHTETGLVRKAAACTGCGKCVTHCNTGALSMALPGWEKEDRTPEILLRSPRVRCTNCGSAMVSDAEYQYLSRVIGEQPWLSLCLDCRTRTEVM